jgi:hyperosmotically inducible protein
MNTTDTRQVNRAMIAAIASAFALAAAGCGEKPSQSSADNYGKKPADTASSKVERATNSAEQKLERAADAAEKNLESAGKALDDATVTAKVKSALIAEPNLKAMSIDVDTTGGVVTLKGTTANFEQKQKAEQLTSAIEGVRSVRNELVVVRG